MNKLLLLLALSTSCVVSKSPTISTGDTLGWQQDAPSLAEARGYKYRFYLDGTDVGIAVAVTCSGVGAPYLCQMTLPGFTEGDHFIQITSENQLGESVKSDPFQFKYSDIPSVPRWIN